VLTYQYIYTLRQAADLFKYFGKEAEAAYYKKLADQLGVGTNKMCYDKAIKIIANTPEKKRFSQHAAIMAVLSESIPLAEEKPLMQKTLSDPSLIKATVYYRFYLLKALKKAGLGDLYYSQLQTWRDMLKVGLTTFAEKEEPTRSDCHAWSASPNYDFLATICGIMPAKAGFASVKIEPALGELQQVKGVMPHPEGEISVSLQRKGANGITADISLPGKLTGVLIWKGKEVILKGGIQKIEL
jgi:alpha-L-rhamnosidase